MYLTQGDIIAIFIALSASLLLMIVMLYANVKLLNENRFLRRRLSVWRERAKDYGKVAF